MSRTAGAWLGEKRITLMACASLLRERDGGGDTGPGAVHARGVALAGGVLDEPGVAGAEDLRGAVAEPDLEVALEDDDELPPRRRMPVDEAADGILAEDDLRRRQALDPVGVGREIDHLEVRLPVRARKESIRSHPRHLLVWPAKSRLER